MDVKLATWNIEWMVSLFGGRWADWDGSIPSTFAGRHLGAIHLEPIPDVTALIDRIVGVIDLMKPDILCVQEGPPRRDQMQLFVDRFLGGAFDVFTANSQWQTNHALVRKELALDVRADNPRDRDVIARWSGSPYYVWGTIAAEDRRTQRFHRQPVVIHVSPRGSTGPALEIVSVHTKSKFSKLRTKEQWERREREAVIDALTVRQKLSAEIAMLRRHFVARIAELGPHHPFVILGDVNDGPLSDELEAEFLIHNIIDELVGSILDPQALLRHGMPAEVIRRSASTRFRNPMEGGALTEELIDHILVSPGLLSCAGGVGFRPETCIVERTAYAAFNDESDTEEDRQLRPSDHLPVSALLTM